MASSELQKNLLGTIGASINDTVENNNAITLIQMEPLPAANNLSSTTNGYAAKVVFRDRDASVSDGARLMNALAALLLNVDIVTTRPSPSAGSSGATKLLCGKDSTLSDLFLTVNELIARVDESLQEHIDEMLHDDKFREIERNWRGLEDLCQYVQQEDIVIDFLDVTKEELRTDFLDHHADIFGSALVQKVYVEERALPHHDWIVRNDPHDQRSGGRSLVTYHVKDRGGRALPICGRCGRSVYRQEEHAGGRPGDRPGRHLDQP